ncbi:MAG: ketoacyl-ACP synthase III [Bacteroidales bacterium]|nr:ketoacyl-ACP synthase III [Bacteroidales bacterium]
MQKNYYSVIKGTGSFIPNKVVKNEDFLDATFYDESGVKMDKENEEIIQKFMEITGIHERRYLEDHQVNSDLGFLAAKAALEDAQTDREELDYIIVAHNFGDVKKSTGSVDMLPSLASRIKQKMGIENPFTVAYDIIFGCPGWIQGLIQANYYIQAGDAKKVMVIGSEALSRVSDPHDRDSMIFADGAGATILEAKESDKPVGILTHLTRSDALNEAYLMWMEQSNNPNYPGDEIFLKMNGRKQFEYALNTVPPLVKQTVEKAGVDVHDLKKVLIHQANEKMDQAMLKRFFKLYGIKDIPIDIMPMTISKLGNNSVGTIPIMLDLILKGEMENQTLNPGDPIVLVSVGAGMNINSIIYQFPKS